MTSAPLPTNAIVGDLEYVCLLTVSLHGPDGRSKIASVVCARKKERERVRKLMGILIESNCVHQRKREHLCLGKRWTYWVFCVPLNERANMCVTELLGVLVCL